jgi:glutamate/aspartate transport system permease protein
VSYTFDWGIIVRPPYGPLFLEGIRTTIELALIGWVFALILGTFIGFARTVDSPVARMLAAAYVEVLRNVPVLVQLFFWYFALPALLPEPLRVKLYSFGWEFGSAIVALTLYTSTRVAEHVRSGLRAASTDAGIAALATGLDWWQAQRHVVAPLVFRLILPALTSEFVTIFKTSSLAMAVGVVETTFVSQQIGSQTFHYIEPDATATAIYLGVAAVVALFMGYLERRLAVPGLIRRTAA